MYRVSKYNIYLKLKKTPGKSLLIQGNHGSFDVVDDYLAKALQKGETDESLLNSISSKNLNVLCKRGYVTQLSEAEEFEFIKKVSTTLNTITRKTITITIIPTYNCNFRCVYCFERNLLSKGKDWLNSKMSIELVDAIFEQINKYIENGIKVESVYLFGGEPLLKVNKDIVEYICQKCKEKDIGISCITNGYDLDQYIDLISEYKFKSVQITIDGTREEHDKRRYLASGQGSYDKIKANVSKALDSGINILARTNVNKQNIQAIEILLDEYKNAGWLEKENFRYYFKSTLRCYEKPENELSDVELMKQLAEHFGDNTRRFQFNSIYNGVADKVAYMMKSNGFAPLRSGYCGANTGMYTIDPYGDIYPCWDVLGDKSVLLVRLILKMENLQLMKSMMFGRKELLMS